MSIPMEDLSQLPVEGYPKLAYHMGRYSNHSIYRRFSSLNSRNLLYFQSELVHLEYKLHRHEREDAFSSEGERSNFSKDWYYLNSSGGQESSDQLDTVLAIRRTLKEYNDAVIQQSVINRLADPKTEDLFSLQDWLERPKMGNLALLGKDSDTWGSSGDPLSPHSDLFSLHCCPSHDLFSSWFTRKVIKWFQHIFWRRMKKSDDQETGIVSYEEGTLYKFTSYFTLSIASLLPLLTVVVLHYVNSTEARLGLIAIFMFIFSGCLSFLTNATRSEVFIATAAFMAVQVVFISTNNTNG